MVVFGDPRTLSFSCQKVAKSLSEINTFLKYSDLLNDLATKKTELPRAPKNHHYAQTNRRNGGFRLTTHFEFF